jgi:hypothetical protein
MLESRSRGVLDTRVRGYDMIKWSAVLRLPYPPTATTYSSSVTCSIQVT